MKFAQIIALAACTVLAPVLGYAQASQANGTAFDDWRLDCRAIAVNQTSCGLVQALTRKDSGAFLAEVRLQLVPSQAGPRTIMSVTTPTNVLLSLRPGFKVAASELTFPLEWRTCTPKVCTANRVLSAEEIGFLQAAAQMVVAYRPFNSTDPVSFAVSLRGVTAGLAALQG